MTEREAYVAFNLADSVGFATVEELAKAAGSVAAAWEAFPKKVSRTGGPIDWQAEFDQAKTFGVAIVTPADAAYPASLRTAPGRPLALYVKGDAGALSKPAIALVGTRRATPYGRDVANRLAYDLAKAGWAVVSGLALGIDAASHRGALDAGGVTVGVLGSGLDRFYPEQNRELARDMAKKGGAVVSEFPFGRPPDRETFPIRNHVVAGLARGLVAVEAPSRSGTLITTSIAADLGRTVMAVPARIDSKMSAGCLQLIRDGAILVRGVDDVLEAMSELFPANLKKKTAASDATEAPDAADAPADDDGASAEDAGEAPDAPPPATPPYSVEEALVMLHVDAAGLSIDELVRKTKLPLAKVNSLAMKLRLKGFVKFLPGNRVALLTGRK